MTHDWQQAISEYCYKYNIPLEYLAETLNEPKVIPMIRGKAFEFSAMIAFQNILLEDEWQVNKEVMNAQLGYHDVDVEILHKPTGISFRCECKLARKEGYKFFPATRGTEVHHEIRVKCMRSRTLGPAMVQQLAPIWGISEDIISVHNDQYLPSDFDIVICSIGNAFYRTEKNTGLFEWMPTEREKNFLMKFKPPEKETLKDFAFRKIYIARSIDLAAGINTGVVCTRRACTDKTNCGFIPDYPIIRFDDSLRAVNGWVPIEESQEFFRNNVNLQLESRK